MRSATRYLPRLSAIAFTFLLSFCGNDTRSQAGNQSTLRISKTESLVQTVMIPVQKNGRTGYIDGNGRWAINPQFDGAGGFIDGIAVASIGGQPEDAPFFMASKWGFIDRTGKWIINPQFDGVGTFSDGLAEASTGGKRASLLGGVTQIVDEKWGFIDKTGTWIINPQFDSAEAFSNGLAAASTGGKLNKEGYLDGEKWGFIDNSGKWVISPQFNEVITSEDDLIAVSIVDKAEETNESPGERWGFVDRSGKWVISPEFEYVFKFSDGLAEAKSGGKVGFIDKAGKWVIKPQFKETSNGFINGFAAVQVIADSDEANLRGNGKWGIIDKLGRWTMNPQFDSISFYSEGLASAQIGRPASPLAGTGIYLGGKWGFIDETGRWAINPQYDQVGYFLRGFAAVRIKGKDDILGYPTDSIWGIIDRTGKWIVDPQFDSIQSIAQGFFLGFKNQKQFILNSEGRIIWAEDEAEVKEPQVESQNRIGSGFYVSADGHVLTNSHVVNNAKEIRISGQAAEIVNEDLLNDLALLKVSVKPASYATFSRETLPKVGEDICTYGFPLAGILSSTGSLSVGTVSSLSGVGNNVSQIQISVPIQPGNSGGPVLNRKGQVVGVVVGKLDEKTINDITGTSPENINFAINANIVKSFLDINNVPYRKSGLFSFKKSNEKIAAEAQKYTVKVECFR